MALRVIEGTPSASLAFVAKRPASRLTPLSAAVILSGRAQRCRATAMDAGPTQATACSVPVCLAWRSVAGAGNETGRDAPARRPARCATPCLGMPCRAWAAPRDASGGAHDIWRADTVHPRGLATLGRPEPRGGIPRTHPLANDTAQHYVAPRLVEPCPTPRRAPDQAEVRSGGSCHPRPSCSVEFACIAAPALGMPRASEAGRAIQVRGRPCLRGRPLARAHPHTRLP